jgi:hypothetical protein
MGYQKRLCQIGAHNSHPNSRRNFTNQWILSWISARHTIRRPMVIQKEPIKSYKTCWEHVPWSMGKVGTRVCHMPNSRTIIAIRQVSRWLRMKLYMDDSAKPHCSGVKLEKAKSSNRKYWMMQKNKFKWFMKFWRLLSLDRRAMRIKEEEISHLKSEISYTSKSHLWEVPTDSGSKGS